MFPGGAAGEEEVEQGAGFRDRGAAGDLVEGGFARVGYPRRPGDRVAAGVGQVDLLPGAVVAGRAGETPVGERLIGGTGGERPLPPYRRPAEGAVVGQGAVVVGGRR